MSINSLSHETIQELCSALEKVPTLNWKVLMKSKSFCWIYTKDGVALPKDSNVLIDDMIYREIKLQHLLNGLKEIGNRKAVSIIEKEAQKLGLNVQDSGGRPPPGHSIDRSQEHEDEETYSTFSWKQYMEEAETLRFPIQEECRERQGHASYSGFGLSPSNVYCISTIFPCVLAFFDKTRYSKL